MRLECLYLKEILEITSSILPFLYSHSFLSALGCFKMIMQLLNSYWPANILAGSYFRVQENELLSPDGICAIGKGLAGHETRLHGLTQRRAVTI